LIEQVAFEELQLHKIFTYAFDLRPHLYEVLKACNFTEEARLKEHCFFNGSYIDVLIHTKIKINAVLRKADEGDLDITFEWANNPIVRRYSVQKSPILFEDHKLWFLDKIHSVTCCYLIFEINTETVGSIRFDVDENRVATISYLLDPKFHGKGLGRFLLFEGAKILLREKPISKIKGLVYKENIASSRAFTHLGYTKIDNSDETVYYEKYF
jgi:RimJ/RimL family protein N-acetyltransferase